MKGHNGQFDFEENLSAWFSNYSTIAWTSLPVRLSGKAGFLYNDILKSFYTRLLLTLKNDDPYVIVHSWPQKNPNTAIVVAEEKPNLIGGKYSLLEAVKLEKKVVIIS